MVRQINPSLARLWTSENSRQYGSAAKVRLENLSEAELRVLDYLELGVTESQFPELSKIARARPAEVTSLLERLGPLITKTSAFVSELTQMDVERQFGEIMRLYLLEHSDPVAALAKRKLAKVFVSSLGRTGLTILRGLAESGLGTVFTADQKRVQKSDSLELGYPAHLVGRQRVQAVRSLTDSIRVELHSRITTSYDRADLAILIHSDVTPPSSYSSWMNRDVPHLGIVFSESSVFVSHVVVPGITPCLACLEVERMNKDSDWAKVAPQLAQLERDLSDSSLSLFAASIAITQSLNLLDGFDFSARHLMTRLERNGAVYQSEPGRANCGCRLEQ